jgi:hypothetical protein
VVRNWWRQDGHALVLDDLADVLDELPSHLVVGTGANGRMRPDPDTIQQLRQRGMTVETLPTAQAVRRFRSSTRHALQPPYTSPANPQLVSAAPVVRELFRHGAAGDGAWLVGPDRSLRIRVPSGR